MQTQKIEKSKLFKLEILFSLIFLDIKKMLLKTDFTRWKEQAFLV